MTIKRFAILAALTTTMVCAAYPSELPGPMDYNIIYKWGFVEKVAGHGTVKLEESDGKLTGTLDGHSIPWGGRLYSVSDTLVSVIQPDGKGFTQDVEYQNGWYTKPLVGQNTTDLLANPVNYRTIDGRGTLSADASTIEAVTITSDMLGFFYLVRLIDFPSMTEGETITLPITYKDAPDRRLQITYNGTSMQGSEEVYDVVFNYSYDGQMSAYPVETLIDADTRIPLSVAAHLLIGHLEMVYAPATAAAE